MSINFPATGHLWATDPDHQHVTAWLDMDPIEFQRKNLMPVGCVDPFSKNALYSDTFNQCMDKGMEGIGYREKCLAYQGQKRDLRRGVGMAAFYSFLPEQSALPLSSGRFRRRWQIGLPKNFADEKTTGARRPSVPLSSMADALRS